MRRCGGPSAFYNRDMQQTRVDTPHLAGRREFLTVGAAAVATACGRKREPGFDGYAFVANEDGYAVAAVDLSAFTVARHIRLNDPPAQVIAHPSKPFVYVLTPRSGLLHEIETEKLSIKRTLQVARSATTMRLTEDSALWVLTENPARLVRIDLDAWRIEWHVALPGAADEFDIARYFDNASGSYLHRAIATYR